MQQLAIMTARLKRYAVKNFAVLLLLHAPAGDARAWGAEGHRMVAEIASRFLSPEASSQITALLADDRLADGQPSHRKALREIAYWADEIKDTSWGRRRGRWHYDNIPVCASAERSHYCRYGNCASVQLARQVAILKNKTAPARERNEALKWIVHLVADIHQPLHAGNHADQGGNAVEVSFYGERDNPPYGTLTLHAIWDVQMVQRLISDRHGEAGIVFAPIADALRIAAEHGSIDDWTGESHRIARRFVYRELPVRFACSGRIAGIVPIDDRYYSKAAPVIENQLVKAGVRLSRVLNESLAR